MSDPLRLMSIHAHPDDEASKGASTTAMYVSQGVEATLICCTGGEEGDILNPEMDIDEVRENLEEVRRQELKASTDIIGYSSVEMLGYRDSGMKDSEANEHPNSFWGTPVEESTERLAVLIRKYRPHVIESYGAPMGGYDHPDHVRVWEITEPAIELAANSAANIEGEPWQVQKLYNSVWSLNRMKKMHDTFGELGLKSPFDSWWFDRPDNDWLITTEVPVGEFVDIRRQALLAHRTQVDPKSPFWFGLPEEYMNEIFSSESLRLVFSRVAVDLPEVDMFAGLR